MDIGSISGLNVNTEALKQLDNHLQSNSYLIGFAPSEADTALLNKLQSSAVPLISYPNLRRWQAHIVSLTRDKLPHFAKVGLGMCKLRNAFCLLLRSLCTVFVKLLCVCLQ